MAATDWIDLFFMERYRIVHRAATSFNMRQLWKGRSQGKVFLAGWHGQTCLSVAQGAPHSIIFGMLYHIGSMCKTKNLLAMGTLAC
ncbi:MAG: hypothetical protein ACUZ77_06950 [Candidatus Brocadiales bacterium]